MPETFNYDITITNRAPVVTMRPNQPPTTGSTGITVTPTFEGHYWDGLEIFAVFKAYTAVKAEPYTGGSVEIPVEVLQRSGVALFVGFQGLSSDGSIVKESQYALLDTIASGTTIEDASNFDEFTPALYAQILNLARAAQYAASFAVATAETDNLVFVIDDVEIGGVTHPGHLLAVRTDPTNPQIVSEADLGAVTAYGIAVEHGYTGTEEEFAEQLTANMATQQSVTQALSQISAIQTVANTAAADASSARSTASAAQTTANSAASTASAAQSAVAGKQAQHKTAEVTLAAGQTSWAPTVQGVTASNTVFVDFAAASYEEAVECMIRCTAQAANSLTFTANTAPENAITVNVAIFD